MRSACRATTWAAPARPASRARPAAGPVCVQPSTLRPFREVRGRLNRKRAAIALVVPLAIVAGVAVAGGDSRPSPPHERFSDHPSAKRSTRVRLALYMPGFGLSYAPRVTYRGSSSHATISGRVEPADGHVRWVRTSPERARASKVKVVRGRFRLTVELAPRVNEFRFRAERSGLRGDVVTAVIRGPAGRRAGSSP